MARDQRRLAAIVSADVAGYSRLMGRDDSDTLARLKAHRRELIDPKIAEYGGRIVKTTGDGLLLEFPSVVDAVRCAVDVQRGMAERNAGVPSEQRIDFRVGVNVGDIIIDGDDIFGDGVNVAARLQALAEAGGICVSKVVRDQVLDKLSFAFEDLGAQQVKNIARPVEVYRVDLESNVQRAADASRSPRRLLKRSLLRPLLATGVVIIAVAGTTVWIAPRYWKTPPPATSPVLSVAVLPLASAHGDGEAARIAAALTRNLTTGLPRKREYGSLYVVSAGHSATSENPPLDAREVGRRLSVRYALEGEVQRSDKKYVINLRLVDVATGGQIGSERMALDEADASVESSAAVRNLSARLRSVIIGAEGRRVTASPLEKLTAPELVLRAFELGGKDWSLAGLTSAKALVDEALVRQPDLVPALVLRAAILNNEAEFDPHADRDRVAHEQERLTARAVRLDNTDPAAWSWRATALADSGHWEAALEADAAAIKLDPYEGRWRMKLADTLNSAGRPAEALTVIDEAIALKPLTEGGLMSTACEAHLLLGQYENAIAKCGKSLASWNEWPTYLSLAAAYASYGDSVRAASAKAEVLRAVPTLTIAQLRAKHPRSPEGSHLAEKHLYEGLRKAGFAEQ